MSLRIRELGDPPMIAEKLKRNNEVTSICPRESQDPPAIDCLNVFRTFQGQSQKEKVKYKISKKWKEKYWCRVPFPSRMEVGWAVGEGRVPMS